MYTELFQSVLYEAHSSIGYEQKLTYSSLLKVIKDPTVRKLLQEASDLRFKLETSEGLYYPIINYEMYKKFQPYVKPDIFAYIDIMAAESNQPTTSDAAFIITWDELIRRTLEKEAFLNNFPSSNRTSAVKNSLYVDYLFYGSDNSPAYDWYTEEEIRTIDPEVKKHTRRLWQIGSLTRRVYFWIQWIRFCIFSIRVTTNLPQKSKKSLTMLKACLPMINK